MVNGSFNLPVKGIACRHVPEGRSLRIDKGPTLRQDSYLRQLGPSYIITRPELPAVLTAGIATNYFSGHCGFDVLIKRLVRWYIAERRRTGGRYDGPVHSKYHHFRHLTTRRVIAPAECAVTVPIHYPSACQAHDVLVEWVAGQDILKAKSA